MRGPLNIVINVANNTSPSLGVRGRYVEGPLIFAFERRGSGGQNRRYKVDESKYYSIQHRHLSVSCSDKECGVLSTHAISYFVVIPRSY